MVRRHVIRAAIAASALLLPLACEPPPPGDFDYAQHEAKDTGAPDHVLGDAAAGVPHEGGAFSDDTDDAGDLGGGSGDDASDDAPPPDDDAGPIEIDSSTPTHDAGPQNQDAGSHPVDSGTDAGPKDSGSKDATPDTSAPDTSAPDASAAQLQQICVDEVNRYRALNGKPPYARWPSAETCADTEAQSDSASGTAHGAFGSCQEFGQCECPGWSGPLETMLKGCLKAMWEEGPGGGHYDIMNSDGYTKVACGFYTLPNGRIWSVQDYR